MSKEHVTLREELDQGAKIVFEDPVMCAQFLDGYIPIECLKGLKPEQIEDMSERFVTMWDNERESDVVKKIHLKEDLELFLITIIEHQSRVDFTMAMKLLRYMVMIWTDYEKEMESKQAGITKTKDFKYPPILPIVYFEGTGKWTAAIQLSNRIALADVFEKYLPDFQYEVVRVHDYSNSEIISKGDEFSLIMLINKLKNSEDIRILKDLPKEYLENLQNHSPRHLLELISMVVSVFMRRMNVPKEEIADFTDQIVERRFSMLFDSFEAYDVQEIRRVCREEAREEARKEVREEVREEARKEVREEAREEARLEWKLKLITQIQKKVRKSKGLEVIADELEENTEDIRELYEVVKANVENPAEDILKIWKSGQV